MPIILSLRDHLPSLPIVINRLSIDCFPTSPFFAVPLTDPVVTDLATMDFTAIQRRNLLLLVIFGLVFTSLYNSISITTFYFPVIDEQVHNKIQNLLADDVNTSIVMKTDDVVTGADAQELKIDKEAVNVLYLEASPARACGLGHW
jgi:ABC-type enterochelin transport system permease subunit